MHNVEDFVKELTSHKARRHAEDVFYNNYVLPDCLSSFVFGLVRPELEKRRRCSRLPLVKGPRMWALFFLGFLVSEVAQGMRAEACATPAYSATALKEGVDAGEFLMDFAIGLEEGRPTGVCWDVPQGAFDRDADEKVVDISMFGTTSSFVLPSLLRMLRSARSLRWYCRRIRLVTLCSRVSPVPVEHVFADTKN